MGEEAAQEWCTSRSHRRMRTTTQEAQWVQRATGGSLLNGWGAEWNGGAAHNTNRLSCLCCGLTQRDSTRRQVHNAAARARHARGDERKLAGYRATQRRWRERSGAARVQSSRPMREQQQQQPVSHAQWGRTARSHCARLDVVTGTRGCYDSRHARGRREATVLHAAMGCIGGCGGGGGTVSGSHEGV